MASPLNSPSLGSVEWRATITVNPFDAKNLSGNGMTIWRPTSHTIDQRTKAAENHSNPNCKTEEIRSAERQTAGSGNKPKL